ncbi:uncharacterized protein LOC124429790 [Vespa crabro]|uniref:uncharacterized protein LOC124429790 n=1 Tax=Vespa crabro TaxID=7445 RepID=UPI001F005784|nr:uncharacterized protein LOC124429790 [Vespa crabro]
MQGTKKRITTPLIKVKMILEEMLEVNGTYDPAPVTLAFKKDENKRSRLCIDFRELNKIVTPQAQPFPLIEDLILKARNLSFEEHIEHIERVMKAIVNEGFRLKFKKCTFATESVKYLGHIIKHNTVRPVKDNLISIRNFPTPKTQKNIRQFLGKINFYHEYIPKSSILLDPLHRLLRKNEKFIWSEECEKSFKGIKNLLCSQPVLQIFDRNLPIRIYTDASLEGIGAIFKQVQSDGKEKPVAYFSKKLNDSQKRKKAIYLECLAIKEVVKYWQHWLIGRKFTIFTDHKPLEGIKQLISRISPYYTAKGITANIKKVCQNCEICIKNKFRGQGKYGRMSQLGPATKPFEIMSIDTIGGFGGQRSTKKYLHLLVDHFTRYVFMRTSKTQSATDFIKLISGILETDKIGVILADQYPGINSKEFREFLIKKDTKLIFTAVNAPFSNGKQKQETGFFHITKLLPISEDGEED